MTDATEHAILNAARAVQHLADDLRGNNDVGTTGTIARNTLRAVKNAAESVEKLAENLRGDPYSSAHNTGELLRAAIKRIGVKS